MSQQPQGLSLVGLSVDISPWRLPAPMLDPLVQLMGDLVKGGGEGEGVWNSKLLNPAVCCLLQPL